MEEGGSPDTTQFPIEPRVVDISPLLEITLPIIRDQGRVSIWTAALPSLARSFQLGIEGRVTS